MSQLKSKIVGNFKAMGSASVVSQLVTWVVTIVVARILKPDDYGLFALAALYFGFVEFVSEFGLFTAIIHRKELSNTTIRSSFTVSILFSLLVSLLTLAFGPLMSHFFSEPRLKPIIYTLSFIFLTNSIRNVQQALMVREMRFKEMARIEVTARIVTSLITLACASAGYGVWSLIVSYFAYSILQAIFYSYYERRLPGRVESWQEIREIVRYGFQVMVARIISFFSNRTDTLIIGKMIGTEVLGGYSVAMNLSNMPIDKLMSIFNQVLFPVFSRVQDDLEKFRGYFLKTLQVQLLVMLPIFALIALSADYLIPLLLGEKWGGAILPLKVFAIIGIFQYLRSLMTMLTNSLGIPKSQVYFNILVLIVTSGGMVVCGYYWRLNGIFAVWLTIYPLLTIGFLTFLLRKIGLRFADIVGVSVKPLVAVTAMTAVVILEQRIPIDSRVVSLGATLAAGVVSYLVVLAMIARDSLKEVVALLLPGRA